MFFKDLDEVDLTMCLIFLSQNPTKPRETIDQIASETRTHAVETEPATGVELNLKEFTDIRFGLDRRLEEVARMLCSSIVHSIKGIDRPELK